jgi:excinuclease ABC subunit B
LKSSSADAPGDFVSATPAQWEKDHAGAVVEQLVRPTGLVDPEVEVRPATSQVDDVLQEIRIRVDKHERVLITTLTKRMAEQLTDYLSDNGVKVRYCTAMWTRWSGSKSCATCAWAFDVLVGINLLREGWIFPRCRWWPFWTPTRRDFCAPSVR